MCRPLGTSNTCVCLYEGVYANKTDGARAKRCSARSLEAQPDTEGREVEFGLCTQVGMYACRDRIGGQRII